ncbi:hypothetical protein LZ30DRAFT_763668 [Colletotrichum cereale]|nr:hypothetical protein LZ30DRAFT_763668 [Colletotrichum cereale]
MAELTSAYVGSLFFGGSFYALLGLMTYTVVNRGRPFDLPQWYLGSARGPRETVLVCLYFPAIVALWPLVLPPCLAARLGFRVPERLRAMARRVRDRGRRMCGGGNGGGGRRDGVDLERWADVSLDGELADGAGGPATWGGFVNPFEGRGRSRSRTRGPEASESRSPRDRGGDDDSAVAGSEQQQQQQQQRRRRPPTVWYTKLPSPAEMMQSAMGQTSPGGGDGGSSSSSSGERGRSPGPEDGHGNGHGNDNSSTPLASRLPRVADEVVDPDPVGKPQFLQRLQTIPEDEGGELGGDREDARLR